MPEARLIDLEYRKNMPPNDGYENQQAQRIILLISKQQGEHSYGSQCPAYVLVNQRSHIACKATNDID